MATTVERALNAVVQASSEAELVSDRAAVAHRLRDQGVGSSPEVEGLLAAIDHGIVGTLVDPPDWAPFSTVRPVLAERFAAASALPLAEADRLVVLWARALALTEEPLPGKAPTPDLTSSESSTPPLPTPRSIPSPGPMKGGRRRTGVAVIVAVALLAAAGISALVVTSQTPAFAADGHGRATLTANDLRPGTSLTALGGPYELTRGTSVVRLADGTDARIDSSDTLTISSGRAYVNAASEPIVVSAGSAVSSVRNGRAMVTCTAHRCTTVALSDGVVATYSGHRAALGVAHSLEGDTDRAVVPDAIRADPWFVTNSRIDATEHRVIGSVPGPVLVGSWLMRLQRADLPTALDRTVTFASACGASGCSITATSWMADDVGRSTLAGSTTPYFPSNHRRIIGTVQATGLDRFTIDYGSHGARCEWAPGTPVGGGIDGTERVEDRIAVRGSGAGSSLAGSRRSTYTPTAAHCTAAAFTATHIARLSASRSLTTANSTVMREQQVLLNYVSDAGTGCSPADAAPSSGRLTDLTCPATGAASRIELATYSSVDDVERAYRAATVGFGLQDTGDCRTSACEEPSATGTGRQAIATTSAGAVLVISETRTAHLIAVVHGASATGLGAWWSDQQHLNSVLSTAPIPRVGV